MGKYETVVEPRLDDIREWIRKGATEKEIAKALGLSYSGFRGYKNKYPQLAGVLTENKRVADEMVLGAFFKRAVGYEVKEVERERIDGKMVVVKERLKQISPDVEAGKFWLKNRLPDEFKDKQTLEGAVGLGKSLEDFI